MKRIDSVLGRIKAAVQEKQWQEVVGRGLNEISKDCAKELQIETGQICNKGDCELGLDEWPPIGEGQCNPLDCRNLMLLL